MTAEQARRAAKILRDLAQSLPQIPWVESQRVERLRTEYHKLARTLEDFALEEYAEEITDKELFDERRTNYSAGLAG